MTLSFKGKILEILEILDYTPKKYENHTVYHEHRTKSTFAIVRKSFWLLIFGRLSTKQFI